MVLSLLQEEHWHVMYCTLNVFVLKLTRNRQDIFILHSFYLVLYFNHNKWLESQFVVLVMMLIYCSFQLLLLVCYVFSVYNIFASFKKKNKVSVRLQHKYICVLKFWLVFLLLCLFSYQCMVSFIIVTFVSTCPAY